MDPNDLGWRYTSDPIPNIRALGEAYTRGYSIVPERFGGSSNTEFEVLTGMTNFFLPEGSLPYRQYLKQPIPSLPRTLKSFGYTTTAIHADPKYYYDRERAYEQLSFDKVVWLSERPEVERAARGRWPADKAIVQDVIHESQAASPFFVFAFPSSTHSPYTFGTYKNSDLNVLDLPDGDTFGEVKE